MGAPAPPVLSRLAKELKELTKKPCEGIRVGHAHRQFTGAA